MLQIVFQNLACGDCFKDIIQDNVLFDHFLLGVLCKAQLFGNGLLLNLFQNCYVFQSSSPL